MTVPQVSVLMAVYNGERFVKEAIDSILAQTFSEFEFILVEDGSTDCTPDILAAYAMQDPRIVLISNKKNIGLTRSLNRGLAIAQGVYLARMDADDISLPERLEKQIAYMEKHPNIGILGTNVVWIDSNGCLMHNGMPRFAYPASPEYARWKLLWQNVIYHSTAMVRRSILDRENLAYNSSFATSQDYDLWARLSKRTFIARISDVCLKYRIVETSISQAQSKKQQEDRAVVIRRELRALLKDFAPLEEGLDTLVSILTQQNGHAQNFAAASDIVIEAYRRFCEEALSDREREQIFEDTIYHLIAILKHARRTSIMAMFALLWHWRYLLLRQCLSLRALKRISTLGWDIVVKKIHVFY